MRSFALWLALLSSASQAWGQSPPIPNPSPQSKATPQPQQPVTQLYRLVPVETPTQQTQQYQTVQLAQQPAPQYQTVQMVQQPIQQVQYVPATTSTFAVANTGQRTVVLGPGLVGLSLARTGTFLTNTFGKSHVWNISHSTIAPQIQPAPPVATQLVTVSMPQPVVQQPVQVQLLQQPVTQQYKINAPSEEAPPPPVIHQPPVKPTPQSSTIPPPKHHGMFGLFGGN